MDLFKTLAKISTQFTILLVGFTVAVFVLFRGADYIIFETSASGIVLVVGEVSALLAAFVPAYIGIHFADKVDL